MKSLLVRRLVQAVPVLLIVICLDFSCCTRAGDAVDALAVELGGSDAGLVARSCAPITGSTSPGRCSSASTFHVVRLDLGWSVGFSRRCSTWCWSGRATPRS